MKSWLSSHQLILSEQYNNATLPHAILISGVSGSGKLELAQWLVQLLNCKQPSQSVESKEVILQACGHCKSCLLLNSNTFPDHLNLIAQKNSLGIDDVRHANSFLQKTAYLGQFKTVLIENAQTMTQAAMNALLKTLEEPSDNSIIILLTNDIEILLPTIISRCRVLNIRPAVGKDLILQLKEQDRKNGEVSAEAHSLSSDPFVNLTQLPELTDAAINEAFKVFKECYIGYLCYQQGESQLLQYLLNNEHALRWLEQITVNLHRDYFLDKIDNEHKNTLNAELLNNLYKVIINGCKVIKSYTQANKQFVCEQLIMAISDVVEQSKVEANCNASV
ncbi:DNA polymerase III subunit delta' [Candidatus Colwellia aromaticivorans]|uniref:DNA polymerase III subunit delta' n=1 Tax=Candidatus Colwellia aromaticivorans TaxID=2267621 RepID=UPI000DF2BC26|nr:DNA polymerase III subunit delta' [Candidatus Colwellia aromaticivorans]